MAHSMPDTISSRGRLSFPTALRVISRSSSLDPACKIIKRKGGRTVSSLTPQQLARKRANDRDAQRAIRARTKEHIESLEFEVAELRNLHDRDQTIQRLLRRNRILEEELHRLKECFCIPTASPYASPTLSPVRSLNTPRSSPFSSVDYAEVLPEFPQPYVQMGESPTAVESVWVPPASQQTQQHQQAQNVQSQHLQPQHLQPQHVQSQYVQPQHIPPQPQASSPLSSTSDEYARAYIPAGLSTALLPDPPMHCRPLAASSVADSRQVEKLLDTHGLPIPQAYLHQQPWNLYPIYYPMSSVH